MKIIEINVPKTNSKLSLHSRIDEENQKDEGEHIINEESKAI